jgi:two-component system, LytTR family, response regulator
MSLRTFVADDEAPARRKIVRFLRAQSDIEIAGEARDGKEAVLGIAESNPDLVFLDVQMPGMDGFEVVEALTQQGNVPEIVFVTAHDQHALRAFEVNALGYLLKPFDEERFAGVLARARKHLSADGRIKSLEAMLSSLRPRAAYQQRFFVRDGERAFFVPVDSVIWIEAARNYLVLHSKKGNYVLRATLDSIEKQLDPKYFVRLNRSALVRIDGIQELESWSHGEYNVKVIDGSLLRWSRLYVQKRPELVKLPC